MNEAVRLDRAAGRSLGLQMDPHEAGRTVLSLFFESLYRERGTVLRSCTIDRDYVNFLFI